MALWRRHRQPAGTAYAPDIGWRPRPWWEMLSLYERRIYQLCAAALLLAGLAAAWVFLVPSPAEFMTEFYVLGEEGLAKAYPTPGCTRGDVKRHSGHHQSGTGTVRPLE